MLKNQENNSSSTIVLDPHPKANKFDHSSNSPTYDDMLLRNIENYAK